MRGRDIAYVAELVQRASGVTLDGERFATALVRLERLAMEVGLDTGRLVAKLREEPAGALAERVLAVVLNHETSFFRDLRPFEELRRFLIPRLIERRSGERALRFWCAACASGQEPYSLAMLLDDLPELAGWRIQILASDLCEEMLARARKGRYSHLEVNRGLPARLLVRHFTRHKEQWCLRPEILQRVELRRINLVAPWPALPPMDLVMLRNALIYFDVATKRDVLARVRKVLRPDGALLLGAMETTLGLDEEYVAEGEIAPYYRPRPAGARSASR